MDSRPMKLCGKCDQQNPKTSPLYVFPTTLGPTLEGLSPATFLHATSCLSPVLEGGPG
jgi:hypothetical protein